MAACGQMIDPHVSVCIRLLPLSIAGQNVSVGQKENVDKRKHKPHPITGPWFILLL